jgi:hypothetical protein
LRQKVVEHGATLGVDVEIVRKVKGFTIIKRRRVVDGRASSAGRR